MRIYPKFDSNVKSGLSVAVYCFESDGTRNKIAQLSVPDYNILKEKFDNKGL